MVQNCKLTLLKVSKCCAANNISESLAESAAAYTKATARKCLLAKVEVITGEEAESNVLQVGMEECWVTGMLGFVTPHPLQLHQPLMDLLVLKCKL